MLQNKNEQDFISAYFKTIDLKESKNIAYFWQYLYTKHNKEVIDRLQDIYAVRTAVAQPSKDDLYEVKNSELALSIDFASFSYDLYKSFFEWFIKREIAPKTILDIGCDNGIVTCFFGLLYPQAEVVGIDPSENGIKCANQLAARLKLKNVTFHKIALSEAMGTYPEKYFELITSIRSFHEIDIFPDLRYWSAKDLQIRIDSADNTALFTVNRLLTDTSGEFISFERLATFLDYVWWIAKLRAAGLFVDWKERKEISFHEQGEQQSMPLLKANKIYKEEIITLEVLQFYVAHSDTIDLKLKKEYFDMEAELAFEKATSKQFIFGMQINFLDQQGDLRLEAWKYRKELLYYQYSNVGYRELKLLPLNQLNAIKKEVYNIKKQMILQGNKTYYYESLRDREHKMSHFTSREY